MQKMKMADKMFIYLDIYKILTSNFQVFQVCFATCFDPNILASLQACKGKFLHVKPSSVDVVYR